MVMVAMAQNATLEMVSMATVAMECSIATSLDNSCCAVAKQPNGNYHEGIGIVLIWPIKFVFSR